MNSSPWLLTGTSHLTQADIQTLRTRAIADDDVALAELCDLALGCFDDQPFSSPDMAALVIYALRACETFYDEIFNADD